MEHISYTMAKDGFAGVLYDAQNGDDRVLLVLQGLKGYRLSARYAALFARHGLSALALSYYGAPGQRQTMRAVPLEQFQSACDAMCARGYRRIGIYGNSKGGGMALLAASAVGDISLVIAASAFGYILQGDGTPDQAMVSYQGTDYPYVPRKGVWKAFLQQCIQARRVQLLYFFDAWERQGTPAQEIPVERIQGDILFLSAQHDESVPAKRDAERLMQRLERAHFAYGYRHICSMTGSHNLGIFPSNNAFLPRERAEPAACQQARIDSFRQIWRTLQDWHV